MIDLIFYFVIFIGFIIELVRSAMFTVDNIANIILFYVTPEINIPFTFGTVLFKSKKTGETATISENIKELYVEIKSNAIKMLDAKLKKYGNIKNISLQSKLSLFKGSLKNNEYPLI